MEYLYSDSQGHHFMNQENYEQITLPDEVLGDSLLYMLPNSVLKVDFYDANPVGIELPQHGRPPGLRDRARHEGRHRLLLVQAGEAARPA